MTQAFNLSQFANNVDSSGKANLTSGQAVTGVLPVANGGTGLATLTSAALLTGNNTGSPGAIVPATNGYVLTSNGSAWSGQPAPIGGMNGVQVYSANGTWTVPTGITKCMVYVHGGGGAGSPNGALGGCGGYAQAFISGLTQGTTISITVGGRNGTSSFDVYATATGGANHSSPTNGSHGSGSVASSGSVTTQAIKLGAVGNYASFALYSTYGFSVPNASVNSLLGGICYPQENGYTVWNNTSAIVPGSGGGYYRSSSISGVGYYGSAGAVAVTW